MILAAAIGLFATICIDGTLHGEPLPFCTLRHEFQIGHYATVEACERGRKAAVDEWFKTVAWLSPHLVAERCGPAEPEEGDDI